MQLASLGPLVDVLSLRYGPLRQTSSLSCTNFISHVFTSSSYRWLIQDLAVGEEPHKAREEGVYIHPSDNLIRLNPIR